MDVNKTCKQAMQILKKITKKIILIPIEFLNYLIEIYMRNIGKFNSEILYYWFDKQINKSQERKEKIVHFSGNEIIRLTVYTPNSMCRFRAETFSSKEPETLKWIDESDKNGVLFDIGANIGLYSIYYAAKGKGEVYAFEPSIFNLPMLAKNIYENNLNDRIRIVTNPLTNYNQFSDFTLSTLQEGGALSAFGVDYGYDGKEINKLLSYQTLGLSLDYLLENKIITKYPTMIKIDVDGIEHLILRGSIQVLQNTICKTVLIEINDEFSEQAKYCHEILSHCGFRLNEKIHSQMFQTGAHARTYNQIWIKD